jgi:hypothetical protein
MSQKPFLPINLLHRHDGWSPEKQWAFVEALSRTASVTQAVRSVGMSAKSAYRLRQHPDAGEFRAAWDAALRQSWGQLEQVALDRVINGERETIERRGFLVAERRKPCSEKLLIHMLGLRERAETAARAERIAAHKAALAEAKLAALVAGADGGRRRGKGAAGPEAPPLPVLADDAVAETAALQAFCDFADRFEHWPDLDASAAGDDAPGAGDATPAVIGADGAVIDADGAVIDADGDMIDADGAVLAGLPDHEAEQAAQDAAAAIEYANRPRWEDHVSSGAAAR